jgi:hypothetical protein
MPDTNNTQRNKLQNLLLVTNEAANSSATNITDAIRPLVQRYGYDLGSKNFDYCKLRAENDDITLYECTNKDITTLVIHPSVTKIASDSDTGVFENTALNTVVFPVGLKSIGKATFKNSKLGYVDIPNTIEIIEEYTFLGNKHLKTITIPDSVTTIGTTAFSSCTNVTDVVLGSNVSVIGEMAFGYCERLTNITIPDSVTTIYSEAFRECSSLTKVIIGDGLTRIPMGLFWDCTSLTDVTIGSNVNIIETSAFYACTRLENIHIPKNVTAIASDALPTHAYYGYGGAVRRAKLSNITVDIDNTAYTSIDGNLYSKDEKTLAHYATGKTATSFIVPSSVTTIRAHAFEYCNSIRKITVPTKLTEIGSSAFNGCTNLDTITLPSTLKSIGSYAFLNCDQLAYINFTGTTEQWASIKKYTNWCNENLIIVCKNGIVHADGSVANTTTISITSANRSLAGYTGVENEELIIPPVIINSDGTINSITAISATAFTGCINLKSVTIPASVTSIGYQAFYDCSNLETIVFEEDSKLTKIEAFTFMGCSKLTSIVLPEGVTQVTQSCFNDCTNLSDVTLPNGVTNINIDAFKNCTSLTGIKTPNSNWGAYLPDSLTTIGANAFYGCSSFEHVILPANITSIGDGAFAYCTSLGGIEVNSSNNPYFTSYKDPDVGDVPHKYLVETATNRLIYSVGRRIPEGIKIIDKYSCTPVKYGRIYLPTSVKEIRDYAFSVSDIYCVNNYTGYTESMTIDQWNKITKTDNWHKAAYKNMFISCKDGFINYTSGTITEVKSGRYYLNGNITLKSTLSLPNTTNTLDRKFSVTLDGTTIKFDSITVTRIGVTYNNSNGSTTVYNSTYGWTNDAYRNIYINAAADYGDTTTAEYVLASSMTEWLDNNRA